MPQAVLPFAYDLLRSFLIGRVVSGEPRSTQPVLALVAALPPARTASPSDMRVLMNELDRGLLQVFSDDRTLLEPGGLVAIPLGFIAQVALEHDGSAAWSDDEREKDLRRSALWPLTLLGRSPRGPPTQASS